MTYKAPFRATLDTGSKDSQGRPALKWDKVTDAAKYEVYRARSKDGTYSLMSTQSATGYTNTSYLANGTTYYYKVRAKNANSTGHFCDAASIASLAAPARPSLTLTTDRSGKPVLKWTSVKDATAYEVFRSTTGAAGSFSIVRRTSYLTWTDANTEMD